MRTLNDIPKKYRDAARRSIIPVKFMDSYLSNRYEAIVGIYNLLEDKLTYDTESEKITSTLNNDYLNAMLINIVSNDLMRKIHSNMDFNEDNTFEIGEDARISMTSIGMGKDIPDQYKLHTTAFVILSRLKYIIDAVLNDYTEYELLTILDNLGNSNTIFSHVENEQTISIDLMSLPNPNTNMVLSLFIQNIKTAIYLGVDIPDEAKKEIEETLKLDEIIKEVKADFE